jgi:hypothetical protein
VKSNACPEYQQAANLCGYYDREMNLELIFTLMNTVLDHIVANTWNRMSRLGQRDLTGGLLLGNLVIDGRVSKKPFYIPQRTRAEHMVIQGKTGTGKSFLLRHMCLADIRSGRGFLFFDHHGDTTPFLLSAIAAEEQRAGKDLSDRLIVIDPANSDWSVGINVLDGASDQNAFVRVIGLVSILKERWGLEHFGAPTEELLRNSLHVLAENQLSLLELAPLLTHASFRAQCLKTVQNADVRAYFEGRFEPMSEPMKAIRRDPVLNKTSEFTSDPHFKYIVGQRRSTFSMAGALDHGAWILVDLNKGRLGKHAATLGSLILAQAVSGIFRRRRREIATLYCDEIQNLLTRDSEIDVLLAEARKFAVSIVSANQFSEQFPPALRAAVQAVGTRIYFQVSAADAKEAAIVLDGGKELTEITKNLPKRNFVVKTGHYPWQQAQVPNVSIPKTDHSNLLRRSRERFARHRQDIECDIEARIPKPAASTKEALDAWD